MTKTWFVTGATRGIGAEIVKAVLKAGDRVVATGGDLQKIEQAGTFGYVPVGGSRRLKERVLSKIRRECYER